ncbi:IS30 family transposase [Spirosoma sp. SC4-14]|uniref:IS30 family transposase n=1 Tax=Spirosoma sp. SC4-14 TaxID=3128900 RepID=UPI0030CCB50A
MANYKQLTLEQRYQIQTLVQQKYKQYEIASFVNVSNSTISREIKKNVSLSGDYVATEAHKLRANRCQREPYKMKSALEKQVVRFLKERYSPEQISGVLALQAGSKQISHESIYKYIYAQKESGNESLISYLRIRHKKKYGKRGNSSKRGTILNRVGIEHRPAIVESNTQVGHWEGDTIIGANHEGVLLTLVERVTKYTIVAKLHSKNVNELANALITRATRCGIPIRTITFDNGKEFAKHQKISASLKADIYFANPYHSWERGLNENTNGLIRQYIPKSCPITIVKKSDVKWIEDQLNNRPRKTLGYLSPTQFALKNNIALQT